MDLNPKESLEFFNKFHESVLDSLFVEQNGKKYQKLQNNFDELIDLANAGNVSLFPMQWLNITMKITAKYYDENLDLRMLLDLYPTIIKFRNTAIELINPVQFTKNEIKEKKEFIKEIYDKLNKNPYILELFESYLTPKDYDMYIDYPMKIYAKIT